MEKIIIKVARTCLYAIAAVVLASCTDALDQAPDGKLSMAEIWADSDMVEQMLNACYNNIPPKGYTYHWFDPLLVACSDDGWTSEDGQGQSVEQMYRDNNSAQTHFIRNNPPGANGELNNSYWDRYWTQIRLCSEFIENIDNAAVSNEENRVRFKAEAHLLRAFFYMEMVKWFGKVPALDHTMALDADYSTLRRQPVYEVAQLIASDCDVAINTPGIPWRITVGSDAMRVTKALAHALKAKAFLFAASPLHHEGHSEYWEEAYQTAKTAVQELKANGYELFTACTNPSVFGTGKAAALHQLVCETADYSASPRDKETIYQHKQGGLFVWHIGYIGSNEDGTYKCGTCPTQELIDAFETEDGVPVLDLSRPYLDEKHLQPNYNLANTTYSQNAPYEKRDPRLSITALYNGAEFVWNNGERKTVNTATGGQHAPSWVVSDRVHSRTGYYHKKMVTPGASNTKGINNAEWKFYRLGELLLDYAEAAAEAGHLADARVAANEVRARSGMPGFPDNLSQADLILRIRNERRVELAWEEQRYFDLRRWQSPDGDLSATCKYFTAMVITDNGGTLTYTRRSISDNPRGGWSNRDLLMPVPLDEVSRLDPLTGQKWQNPGW
ncbi:MAG: RagB/SusD family nutrient uptake outer membrane protein [Bacteroidales bacterium]|nr:RagB/SusD family nutrient uptake outer membrane protein [Bacteroidales bacterium]